MGPPTLSAAATAFLALTCTMCEKLSTTHNKNLLHAIPSDTGRRCRAEPRWRWSCQKNRRIGEGRARPWLRSALCVGGWQSMHTAIGHAPCPSAHAEGNVAGCGIDRPAACQVAMAVAAGWR